MPVHPRPDAQADYQVRLEWGREGWRRLAPADVVVVVDVFGLSAEAAAAVDRGTVLALRPGPASDLAREASEAGARVVVGGIRTAATAAAHVLAVQHARGERTSVAIVALGAAGDGDTGPRFAVQDHLGAGAVVVALGDLGIDHASPDAAVAGEGYRALRGAVRHLLTASGAGRAMERAGRRDEVLAAAERDGSSVAPVLRGAVFVAG